MWHHERWNGEGYPDGLKGEEIPIAAQVVALADAYNSLTNQEGGKEAYSHEKILALLHGGVCGSFNPVLLECLDDMKEELSQSQPGRNWEVVYLIKELEKIGKA